MNEEKSLKSCPTISTARGNVGLKEEDGRRGRGRGREGEGGREREREGEEGEGGREREREGEEGEEGRRGRMGKRKE